MSALVERIPLTTERKALKVIRVCQLHQLTAEGEWRPSWTSQLCCSNRVPLKHCLYDAARSICRVLAVRAYRRGRLGNSLTWCIRAKVLSLAVLTVAV